MCEKGKDAMPKAIRNKLHYNGKYDAANYKMVVIKVKRDSELLNALERCTADAGVTKTEYIKRALWEMLGCP